MPSRVGFEFRAGFLVPSRAWGSYPFSPFHRSTDYFLGTIGRVRMKGIYDRDFPIDDESAAIEIRRIPNSAPSNPIHCNIEKPCLNYRPEKGSLIILRKFKCALSLAPKSSTKYRRKGVTFHQELRFLSFLWILYNQLTNKNFKIYTKWNKIIRDKILN